MADPPPGKLPQFDHEMPSFRLLPIEYPDYNAIDSIDTQNVLRLGFHNKLQTKREGKVEDLVNWNLYTDLRLDPREGQTTFLASSQDSWAKTKKRCPGSVFQATPAARAQAALEMLNEPGTCRSG